MKLQPNMKHIINLFLIFLIFFSCFNSFQIPNVKAQESKFFGNPSLPNWLNVSVVEDSDFIVVDNADGFVFKFRKGKGGYNEIWQNNTQIVANEQWILQYLAQAKWKQRGIPQYVTWEQPEPYHVLVKRFYDDFLGTTFNITYTFYGGFRCKISFEGNIAQANTYRVVWKISGINKIFLQDEPSKHHVKFWNSGEEAIVFDYSDVYESFGNITTIDVEEWANNHKLNEIFNVGSLNVGFFILDPNFGYETAGTSYYTIVNRIEGSVFTCSENGMGDSITAYLEAYTIYLSRPYVRRIRFKYALYIHSNQSFVAGTVEAWKIVGAPSWQTLTFASPPNLVANTEYILVAWAKNYPSAASTIGSFYYDSGDANQGHSDFLVYGNWPNPYEPVHTTKKYSIYCTYTPPVTAEWHNVEIWYGDLITRQWAGVESWYGELITRQWSTIESWYGKLITKSWQTVETWFGELVTKGWHTIESWYGKLTPINFIYIIIGLLTLLVIFVIIIYAIAEKRKR